MVERKEQAGHQLFRSTRRETTGASLRDAIMTGQAQDGGLYMPEIKQRMSPEFMKDLPDLSFQDVSFEVAKTFLSGSIKDEPLRQIVEEAFNFDISLVPLGKNTHLLELFHGPTAAFKDFGARFMAGMVSYALETGNGDRRPLTILVATSGDTGSAVANAFLDRQGIRVTILYPKGKVSKLQEKQLTTYGEDSNIWTLEVDGSFDDCQRLVKEAFSDESLKDPLRLSSANSINIARLLPQIFYYFWTSGQLRKRGIDEKPVFSVPSGNFGNLTAGVFAKRMGLPVEKFVAATNVNRIVPDYLAHGVFNPVEQSIPTNSPSMDVGNPNNFERLMDLYKKDWDRIRRDIWGISFSEEEKNEMIQEVYETFGYVMDPHSVVGYLGLKSYQLLTDYQGPGVALMTAHPAKFPDTVVPLIGDKIPVPKGIKEVTRKKKESTPIGTEYEEFRQFLMDNKDRV